MPTGTGMTRSIQIFITTTTTAQNRYKAYQQIDRSGMPMSTTMSQETTTIPM